MSDINAAEVAVDAIQNLSSLVEMNQHKFGWEKTDSKTTAEVKQQKKASGRAGKYKVNLANGFERDLQALTRIMSRAYHMHMRMTMPWGDGERLLPNLSLIPYLSGMQEFKAELDVAKGKLLPQLQGLIQRAVQLNGELGRISDYPPITEIIEAYSFDFDFTPVAAASGFAGLPEGFQETFVDKYNARVQDRMAAGVQDNLKRIDKVLEAFSESLKKDKPKFYQTTFDNLSQLTSTLRNLNIAGDSDINDVAQHCETICQYTPAHVRDNMTIRQAVDGTVDGLRTALDSMIVDRGVDEAPVTPTYVPPTTVEEHVATPHPEDISELGELLGEVLEDDREPLPDGSEVVELVATVATEPATDVDDDIATLFGEL